MALERKHLKYGCLGCLGLVAFPLLLVLVVSGVAYFTARPEQVAERSLMARIPAGPAGSSPAGGQLAIAVREAEVRIEPADPGEPIRVEGRYDVNAFALDGEFEPTEAEDGSWTYRVTFGRAENSGAFAGLVSLVRGSTARIVVSVPADLPLDLDLKTEKGSAVVRLAGLWLRTAEIEIESGAIDLDVYKPLREPMESLRIHTSRGGSLLNHLGNASPRKLDVSYSMGLLDMDLSGKWLEDAEIHIEGDTGGGVVHLPSGVTLEGLHHRGVEARGDREGELPTLRFSVATGLGRLEFAP